MLKVTIVVGNPKAGSRTGKVATLLVEKLFHTHPIDLQVIDLAEVASSLFDWPSPQLAELNKRVSDSNFAVFACPTYKAAYTGLLKSFLDRYPHSGLQGVVGISLMTGMDMQHSLAPTVTLNPLLNELGAVVPVSGLYFDTRRMDQVEAITAKFADQIASALAALAPVFWEISRACVSKADDAAPDGGSSVS